MSPRLPIEWNRLERESESENCKLLTSEDDADSIPVEVGRQTGEQSIAAH